MPYRKIFIGLLGASMAALTTVLAPTLSAAENSELLKRKFGKASCHQGNYDVKGASVLLNSEGKSGQLFALTNISNQAVVLNHPTPKSGAGAGWASLLTGQHTSILALDEPSFAVSCHNPQKAGNPRLPCHSVLEICSFEGNDPQGRVGRYWLKEDMTKEDFAASLDLIRQQRDPQQVDHKKGQ